MSHSIKVSAVVYKQVDDNVTERVVTMTWLMPCNGHLVGWQMDAAPVPLQAMTLELVGPDIDSLVAEAREEGKREVLDKLANMEGAFQDLFGEHPDLRITDEDW